MSTSEPQRASDPSYDARTVEQAAQAHWRERDAFRVVEADAKWFGKPARKKFYACSMLPYPSGKLHMGHVRNYTINDMLARQLRMKGMNVLMPMGWDAFGLPAENAAMKNGVPPAKWTYDNIAHMKAQMQALGLAIDWSREVTTCKPDYYRWNQWLFLKMLEAGIAERRTQVVNWDPVDQTVLANEQVIDGRGWRSGAPIEKREIPGYYLKITKYADELLAAVRNGLPGWPERVKTMQENWIGKSAGVRFAFLHDIRGADGKPIQDGKLFVFTTRADTIMGVTFCAVAPEHPLAQHAAARNPQLAAAVERWQRQQSDDAAAGEAAKKGGAKDKDDKEGLPTGLFVTHPLTHEPIEVWVANYVLMAYGDGAVMGVPAHDERDFAFAKKYRIPILQVIEIDDEADFTYDRWQDWYAFKDEGGERAVTINSDYYSGLHHDAAVAAIARALAAHHAGERVTTWRLRDWGISRQRYWGTPIPIVHCAGCGAVPVPERDLPVVLPEDLIPDGSGNPLARCEAFLNVACPRCGKAARRETDTMDTFVDSSWYFMRYCDPKLDGAMVGKGTAYWMPMDQYIGGIEHAILHLLYARFWTRVMRDLKLVSFDEPFTRLLTQGMVLNHIYSRRTEKGGIEYFWPDDVEPTHGPDGRIDGAVLKRDGSRVDYDGVGTMSKSKNNGVDPQKLIDRYGADTARLFVMFAAPPEQTLEWNDAGVEGAHRFLRRLWTYGVRNADAIRAAAGGKEAQHTAAAALRFEVHGVLGQIDYDYERMQYNTVVSGAMKLLNALEGFHSNAPVAVREAFGILLRVLYPACPHVTHALWQRLGYDAELGDLVDAPWPQVDKAALVQDSIELMLQVNGKLRGAITVSPNASKKAIEAAALASAEFKRFSEGRHAKKVIIVPGRLVNVVV